MGRIQKGKLARILSSLLVSLVAAPTLLGWALALPSAAQITSSAQLELVAVVPFSNLSATEPQTLADKTTAAVHQGLLDANVFDVRPLEETRQKMADLGMRPPLNELDFQRLGEALGVSGIVFGEIRSAGIRQISRTCQGEVVLMIGVYDVATHTMQRGTITVGNSSPAAPDTLPEKLIDEALNQAVFQAIKQLQAQRPITGVVQWSRGDDVMINIGSNAGVEEGMLFVIVRDNLRVGIVKTIRVERRFSDAKLVEGSARTGDKLRQIYVIPATGQQVELPGKKSEQKKSRQGLWAAIAAAALLVAISSSGSSARSSNTAPGTMAASVSNIRTAGIPEVPASFFDTGGGAILVRWKQINSPFVAGYEIYRDGTLIWFVPRQSDTGSFVTFPNDVFGREVTITIDEVTGTPIVDVVTALQESSGVPPASTVTGIGTEEVTYILRGDFYNESELEGMTIYVGPPTGTHHTFSVAPVVVESRGTGINRTFRINRGAASRGMTATYIRSTDLLAPANGGVEPNQEAVTFAFSGVLGADDYILQLSLDSQFPRGSTVVDNLSSIDGPHSPSDILSTTLDLTTLLGPQPAGTTVFWRIGARWRGDSTRPLPYPPTTTPPDTYRYVFSDTSSFIVQ